jgi:diketogulonate reductase-like aldo/keto reductase
MNSVALPAGVRLPALGLGTWHMGEAARTRAAEVAAVRLAIEIGYRVIDTAEMYGEGGAEEVVGQAVAEALRAGAVARDELFIVSKVYPHNASRAGVAAACDRSLLRLALDSIDLYLLHWPGPHPLRDTVAGFEALRADGRIRHWGVSNFDTAEMKALADAAGARCAANQVYYSLSARGAEFDLLPWQRERSIPLMAYCPLDQGGLVNEPVLREVADRHDGATASQVALAWLMSQRGVMVIPKAVREPHLRENFAAADLVLDAADLGAIERRFPPPRRKQALAMR